MGVYLVQSYILRYDLAQNRPWIVMSYQDGGTTKNVNYYPPAQDAAYYAKLLREEAPVYYVEASTGQCWLTTSAEPIGEKQSRLADPTVVGPHQVTSVTYAGPGLVYGASMSQYAMFQTPPPEYVTRRFDVSDFGNLGYLTLWPFESTNVPINGLLRIPAGAGPFPLVLFAHGNHSPMENSTPGYMYLCDLLASRGFLAASIDVNFLNGGGGENDARAIVQLEHVRQFAIWNKAPGHPLFGKVDMRNVLLVGHSRGGEAVGHASLFNRLDKIQPSATSPEIPLDGSHGLGPYKFSIRGVVGIAPTDGQYQPITGPTDVKDAYLLIHGSRDGDVSLFPGYRTYDRSHRCNPAAPAAPAAQFKSLVWVHQANHNYFNSVWAAEGGSPSTLSRADQERIAKVYICAFAEALLHADGRYRALFRDPRYGAALGWVPPQVKLVTQYHAETRRFIQNFETSGPISVSPPVQGSIETVDITAEQLLFDCGAQSHLYQETHGLRVTWSGGNAEYRLLLAPASLDAAHFDYLSLRVGQSSESNNPKDAAQDFSIELSDGSKTMKTRASEWGELRYPDTMPARGAPKTVMQTLHIPLDYLRAEGLDPTQLRKVALRFDRVANGRLYIDDIALSM